MEWEGLTTTSPPLLTIGSMVVRGQSTGAEYEFKLIEFDLDSKVLGVYRVFKVVTPLNSDLAHSYFCLR
jgi:hypothetical protein